MMGFKVIYDNKATMEELQKLHEELGLIFVFEDGKIARIYCKKEARNGVKK